MRKRKKVAMDLGNEGGKLKSDESEAYFRHAIRQVPDSDLDTLQATGDLDSHPHIFTVNETAYYVGDYALRNGAGAVLYGESRYTSTYYGVLAAIGAFKVFSRSEDNLFFYGGHTPKDRIYRADLINSVRAETVGSWRVKHLGVTKEFAFTGANGYDEPVGIYRHATLTDDGRGLLSGWLRSGECLIIDIGGYTTAFSVAVNGAIDYTASDSRVFGIINVLRELGLQIRKNNRTALKGAQELDSAALRAALTDPARGYDARGRGWLSCVSEADSACQMFMRELDGLFQQFGGASGYHSILLGGGGGALLEHRIKAQFNFKNLYLPDPDRSSVHMAGVRGAFKVLNALEAGGKL